MAPIARPLGLGELLAETARLYGERFWAALGIGAVIAAAFVVGLSLPEAPGTAFLVVVITLVYGAAARIVSGDSFGEAWGQVALRLAVLLVLGIVVIVPFALAAQYFVFLIVAAGWLGLLGFSIPVAMLEKEREPAGWFWRIGYSLRRSLALARVDFMHAFGIAAALMLVYVFVGTLLTSALIGFAENSGLAALTLVQVVLAPLFFFGLAVLYFDQSARALSSRRESRQRRSDADVHHPVEPERPGPSDAAGEPRTRP